MSIPELPPRLPTQPFGSPPPENSIVQYRPPSQRWAWVALAAAGVLAVAIAITATMTRDPAAAPAAAEVSQPAPRVPNEPTSSLKTMPFTGRDGTTGDWYVTGQEWLPGGLRVTIHVEVRSGLLAYQFHAFSNTSSTVYDPLGPDSAGELRPGEAAEITLAFELPQEDATLVLTNDGQQLSALPIRG